MNTIGSHIKTIGRPMHMPCRSVSSSVTRGKNMEWLSYKQYVDAHGKEEADAFIQAGTVMVREHPKNPRFFQFCNESEYLNLNFTKRKELNAHQQKAIKSKEFKQLQMGISKANLSDVDINAADFSGGEGDPDDPDDPDDGAALPKGLLTLMGKSGKANSGKTSKASPDDKAAEKNGTHHKLDNLSSVAGESKASVMKKAHKMHSLLLAAAPNAPDLLKKNIQKKANELSKLIMDDSSKGIKNLLCQSVAIHRRAEDAIKAKAK
jgi:hypothetical protein